MPNDSKFIQYTNDKNVDVDDYPVDVHGGITYFDEKDGNTVLGFDTAHYTDWQCGKYMWDEDKVKAEIKCMVDQIVDFKG
ncbi:hypothetical protein [Apilactobacillus xinyiensis]|uniref:hypothetical protein n=1 Tax=Apilactobacillus xinyiensis TaxID=2841032 RepID=UPI001C7E190F|nr:hypothetical protein [Apilactobacillus xinyiensis]